MADTLFMPSGRERIQDSLNDLKNIATKNLKDAFGMYVDLLNLAGYKVTRDNWWRPVMALGATLGAVGGAVYVAGDFMHHGPLSQLADNMLGLNGMVPTTGGKIASDLSGTARDGWYKHVPQVHEMIGDFGLDLNQRERMGSTPIIGIALGEVVGLNSAGAIVDVTTHINEFVPPVDHANIGVDGVGLTIGSYVYKDQKGQGKGGLLFATQLGQGDVVAMTDQINLANCDAQGMCPVRLVAWDPTKDKFVPLDLPDGKPAQVIVKIKFDPNGVPTEIQGILPGQTGDQIASTIGVSGNKAVQDILFTGKPTAVPPTETPTPAPTKITNPINTEMYIPTKASVLPRCEEAAVGTIKWINEYVAQNPDKDFRPEIQNTYSYFGTNAWAKEAYAYVGGLVKVAINGKLNGVNQGNVDIGDGSYAQCVVLFYKDTAGKLVIDYAIAGQKINGQWYGPLVGNTKMVESELVTLVGNKLGKKLHMQSAVVSVPDNFKPNFPVDPEKEPWRAMEYDLMIYLAQQQSDQVKNVIGSMSGVGVKSAGGFVVLPSVFDFGY